jgi:hypothetical protein
MATIADVRRLAHDVRVGFGTWNPRDGAGIRYRFFRAARGRGARVAARLPGGAT